MACCINTAGHEQAFLSSVNVGTVTSTNSSLCVYVCVLVFVGRECNRWKAISFQNRYIELLHLDLVVKLGC